MQIISVGVASGRRVGGRHSDVRNIFSMQTRRAISGVQQNIMIGVRSNTCGVKANVVVVPSKRYSDTQK